MPDWQPTAVLENLRARARVIDTIRRFFAERSVLEVETPTLSTAAVSDPHLFPFVTDFVPEGGGRSSVLYLHTSPEYPMKRLLAAGSGPIWQICKVFRNGETGRKHNPEFSMLEWYRPDFDHHLLMDEVDALVRQTLSCAPSRRVLYSRLFAEHLGVELYQCPTSELAALGREHCGFIGNMDRDGWLNLLFSHCIEPKLIEPTMVYGFPASQAALARVVEDDDTQPCAARFELFINGMELANGYFELTDAAEQARRFASDQNQREALGRPRLPVDQRLVQALVYGLPDCAGVALGVDRLVMLALQTHTIDEVLAFPLHRA